jgi:hypothetical protein
MAQLDLVAVAVRAADWRGLLRMNADVLKDASRRLTTRSAE